MSRRSAPAALLLVTAAVLATATVAWLGRQPGVPERWARPALLLSAALVLGVIAGALAGRAAQREGSSVKAPALRGGPWPRLAAAVVAIGAGALTWILQGRADHSLLVLPIWAAAVAATVAAFPATVRVSTGAASRLTPGFVAAFGVVLLVALGARVIGLDRVLPVFSGDEATIAMDGTALISSGPRSDVFGAGANSSMRLGMLPAGVGAKIWSSKIGGPRLVYGFIGLLAVAATAGVAGLLGGAPWGALSGAALIALCPHHVHFSRSSNNVILDSLFVTGGALFLLLLLGSGSPRHACLAGVFSGLALYGYGGGRVMPVALVMSLPVVLWRCRTSWRRQALVTLALFAGFLAAGGPNLRFAASRFSEWNGRFNQTSVFAPEWHRDELSRQGSEAGVLINQFRLGTIGLLSSAPTIDIYTGHPMIAPAMLPALGIVGLGWVLGRRRFAQGFIAALVVGGNLAGVALTMSTPQPQRASSLVPMLAALGGAAVAGFLGLLPARVGEVRLRAALGALLIGVFLAREAAGFPLNWEPYAEAGGRHAAFAQSMASLVAAPAFAGEKIYFHGAPFLYWEFPSIRYLLPGREAVDVFEERPGSFPPGLHVCSEEYRERGRQWARDLGIRRGVALAHPAYPRKDLGFAFRVPAPAAEGAPVDHGPGPAL